MKIGNRTEAYQEPVMELVVLPSADVFTLNSNGDGSDIIDNGNGVAEDGNWLRSETKSR